MNALRAKEVIKRLVRELKLCNRQEELAALRMFVESNITMRQRIKELEGREEDDAE